MCLLPVVVSVPLAVIIGIVGEYPLVAVTVFAAVEALDKRLGAGIGRLGPVYIVSSIRFVSLDNR